MKKTILSFFVVFILLLTVGSPMASASQIPENIAGEDETYYYVVDEPTIQTRTWAQAQSWSIVKGTRTYVGTITKNPKAYIDVSAVVGPVTIKIGASYSVSGKFKKYKQNAKITVTYKVYRKVDNKYVRTQTAVSNTYYYDYVAV